MNAKNPWNLFQSVNRDRMKNWTMARNSATYYRATGREEVARRIEAEEQLKDTGCLGRGAGNGAEEQQGDTWSLSSAGKSDCVTRALTFTVAPSGEGMQQRNAAILAAHVGDALAQERPLETNLDALLAALPESSDDDESVGDGEEEEDERLRTARR